MIVGKYTIELNMCPDGTVFVNFWDYAHGNDVIAELRPSGELIIDDHDQSEGSEKKIDFLDYINLVKGSISKRTI